jgi:hypothetical protein
LDDRRLTRAGRAQVSAEEARSRITAAGEPYKLEILEGILARDASAPITIYHIGDKEHPMHWCAGARAGGQLWGIHALLLVSPSGLGRAHVHARMPVCCCCLGMRVANARFSCALIKPCMFDALVGELPVSAGRLVVLGEACAASRRDLRDSLPYPQK